MLTETYHGVFHDELGNKRLENGSVVKVRQHQVVQTVGDGETLAERKLALPLQTAQVVLVRRLEQPVRHGGQTGHPAPVAVREHGSDGGRLNFDEVDLSRGLLQHVVEQHGAEDLGLAG